MWNDSDNRIMKLYDGITEKKADYPEICPVCGKKSGHVYLHIHDMRNSTKGGIWLWCSECRSFAHMSGRAPVWWSNPDFIDFNLLVAEPEYLDKNSEKLDAWFNLLACMSSITDIGDGIAKCEKCGDVIEYFRNGNTQGWKCPTCGDMAVTTYMEPIYKDKTVYTIHIKSQEPETDKIKVISKVYCCHFPEAKQILLQGNHDISVEARDIKKMAIELTKGKIDYSIEPVFPYSTDE